MIAAVVAIGVGAACAVAAWRRLSRVRATRQERFDPRHAAAGLTPGETGRVIAAVLGAPSRAHAVAELNDHLREIDHELDLDRSVPLASARIALAAGALGGVVELLGGVDATGALLAAMAFGWGTCCAAGAAGVGRLADSESKGQRAHWDRVARWLERHLDEGLERGLPHSVDRHAEER